MTLWIPLLDFTYTHIVPASLVGCAAARPMVSTAPARDVGISLLMTRPGSASSCFKYHKAQTQRHLAPGCKDALSGLDPANTSCLPLNGGHTETKGYSGGIGLCLLTVNPTIKPRIGRDTLQEFQSTSYVRARRKLVRRARSSRRLAVDIVISTGGITDARSIV